MLRTASSGLKFRRVYLRFSSFFTFPFSQWNAWVKHKRIPVLPSELLSDLLSSLLYNAEVSNNQQLAPPVGEKALLLDTPSFSFPLSHFWYAINHPPDCWSQLSIISHSVAMNEKKGSDSTRGLCRSFSGYLDNMWASTKEEPLCGEHQEAVTNKGYLFPRMLFDDRSTCHPAETVAFWDLRLIQGKNSSKHSESIKHGVIIYPAFWGQPQKKRHCLEAEV